MAPLLFFLPAVLCQLLLHPAPVSSVNYLHTGQRLMTDRQLENGDYSFAIQGDCNLVLRNGGWQSNTTDQGQHCTLSLNNRGRLSIIEDGSGRTVWSSGSEGPTGQYAAVLHPRGKVVVYGPAIWSTRSAAAAGLGGGSRNAPSLEDTRVGNLPTLRNTLFSGQVLAYNDGLELGIYLFAMQDDCNLVLYNGGFQSNTHANGEFCFLRLDRRGKLTILDDLYQSVWTSRASSSKGDYVLLLQLDGRATVYGPSIWSTETQGAAVGGRRGGNIAMVAGEK